MKIIYPISFDDVQVGDWVDWNEEGTHYHDQITEVTPLSDGRKTIHTERLVFIGNAFKFNMGVISRVVDDSYKPKPKVPTEPGFYRDKDGDLWEITYQGKIYSLRAFGNIAHPTWSNSLFAEFAPYIRVKFVDCEES
ncbi:hypothetical protein [Bifidobacterium aquikefiri]|uniref:hypothetical protein n=1 Tax=Bifidobacterium aquikefiri TaxID=1653207 RepID=UPI0039E96DD8